MRRSLLALLVCIGCLGQMCGGPGLLDEAGAPVPQLGIPEGVYIGEVWQTTTMTIFSSEGTESLPGTRTYTLTKEFGPSGLELTVEGSPLSPGATKSVDLGPGTMTGVVHSVSQDVGQLVVDWEVVISMSLPEVGVVELVGNDSEVYQLQESGAVSYSDVMDAASSTSVDGGLLMWHLEITGTLNP